MPHSLLVGAHLSIAGGFTNSLEAAAYVDATAMQIFTKSNRALFGPNIATADAEAFKTGLKNSRVGYVMVHAGYLINLASSNKEVAANSAKALKHEMQRCATLGIQDLVLHPGSHTGQGIEKGVEQVTELLHEILSTDQTGTRILLETMAGQGSTIGFDFAQLAAIRHNIKHTLQLGFCVDTCHIFAAGYDLTTDDEFAKTTDAIAAHLGWHNIFAVHLNDSQTPLNSKIDRHANWGRGHIGIGGVQRILHHSHFKKLPLILETPINVVIDDYKEEIGLVRKLSQSKL